jgi:hypothetical protein
MRVFRQSRAELPTILGLPGSPHACANALLERVWVPTSPHVDPLNRKTKGAPAVRGQRSWPWAVFHRRWDTAGSWAMHRLGSRTRRLRIRVLPRVLESEGAVDELRRRPPFRETEGVRHSESYVKSSRARNPAGLRVTISLYSLMWRRWSSPLMM